MAPLLLGQLIGAGVGLIGGIGKMFGRGRANRELEKIQARNMRLANERLNLAKMLFQGRMPSASLQERNIYANEANTLSNINRNATDASQALLMGAGAQGVTNQALNQLNQQELEDYQRRYGNLENANQVMQQALYDKAQIGAAQQENRQNTWGDISNFGFAAMNAFGDNDLGNFLGKNKIGLIGGNGLGRGDMSAMRPTR